MRILAAFFSSTILTMVCSNALPYESWAGEAFSSDTDAVERELMANPDGDGMVNVLEWFFGLDPEIPDDVPIKIRREGDEFVIEFRRAVGLPVELEATLEISADLVGWEDYEAAMEVVGEIDGVESIVVRAPVSGGLKEFFRIVVYPDGKPASDTNVGWWGFDESVGDEVVIDNSGYGSSGTLENGVSRVLGVGGGGAVAFDGVDGYVKVPLTSRLKLDGAVDRTGAFTITAWVKLDDAAELESEDDEYMILAKGIWTKPPFFEFGIRGGAYRGLFFRLYNSSGTGHAYERIIPTASLSEVLRPEVGASDWHHVAFVREEGGRGTLYLDGHPVGTNLNAGDPVDPPTLDDSHAADSPLENMWIGRGYTRGGSWFHGSMDEVGIVREALSATQLAAVVATTMPSVDWQPWEGFQSAPPEIVVAPPPLGSDANPGTEQEPYATVGRALDAAHDQDDGRSHIFVKHGVYREGLTRRVTPDSAISRLPGELYITRPGIVLEGEPAGGSETERVYVKGSLAAGVDPAYPLASRYPTWEDLGGGLYKSYRPERFGNAQMVFLDGAPLLQYGDVWMAGLNHVWRGFRAIPLNDPQYLPVGSFYSAEVLEICVPSAGGRGISDGYRISIRKGNSNPVVFELNEKDDFRFGVNNIIIAYSNGRTIQGEPDGEADTQAQLVASIMEALQSSAAASLGLEPTASGGAISLGARDRDGGDNLSVSTTFAGTLACHRYELFVKLPAGLDPSDPSAGLELSYSPQLLAIRAAHTKVKGITFSHNNSLSISSTSAILVNADDIVLEGNDVIWCDTSAVSFMKPLKGGLREPIKNLLLLNNRFSHCGHSGFGGTSSRDCRFIGNETSGNNWRRFNPEWHAGGFKLVGPHEKLLINQHTARFNHGYGIWFDAIDGRFGVLNQGPRRIDDVGVTVSECVSELNDSSGFHYEISRNGRFFDNVARYNRRRGFYLSNCLASVFERNLVVGNPLLGFGLQTTVRTYSIEVIKVPATHPLRGNWSNRQMFGTYGVAGNLLANNIIRNNATQRQADHDADDAHLSELRGWGIGNLPLDLVGSDRPVISIPIPTFEKNTYSQSPLVVGSTGANTSDYNVLWQTNQPVKYGYWYSHYMDWSQHFDSSEWDGAMPDMKDFDRASDGRADGKLGYRGQTLEMGGTYLFEAFPSAAGSFDFESHSEIRDSFVFLDPDTVPGWDPSAGIAVLDPDSDGDGMTDWWEALHGLDASDSTGDNGAGGDPDGDGRSNHDEFELWKTGERSPGVPFQTKEEFLEHTDPTFTPAGNGGARDEDGDGIPSVWEMWYGLDPKDPADGAAHLETFLAAGVPGPPANDSDGDLLPDEWEIAHFGDLVQTGSGDDDGDGYDNLLELRLWTLPNDPLDPPDADADGLSDTWEKNFMLLTSSDAGLDGPDGDPDGDGVANREEFLGFSNPRDPHSMPEP